MKNTRNAPKPSVMLSRLPHKALLLLKSHASLKLFLGCQNFRKMQNIRSLKIVKMETMRASKRSRSVSSILLQLETEIRTFENMKWKSMYVRLNREIPYGLLRLVPARKPCATVFVSILCRLLLAISHMAASILFAFVILSKNTPQIFFAA